MNKLDITLITGACGGLGQSFCYELVKKNQNLLLCGTNENKLSDLKNKLQAVNNNVRIYTFVLNLLNHEDIDSLIDYVNSNNLKIVRLINNAGFITEGSIANARKSTLLEAIKVNCEGTIYLTKSVLDNKKDDDKLNIITISSLASCYPLPYMAIYAATKSLIKNFMLALRYEYKDKNVKVLVVQPGAIATSNAMKEAIKAQGIKGELSSVSPDKIASKSLKKSAQNKANYIPGFFNKFTKAISYLCPMSLQIKFAGKMWKKSQQKRNIE